MKKQLPFITGVKRSQKLSPLIYDLMKDNERKAEMSCTLTCINFKGYMINHKCKFINCKKKQTGNHNKGGCDDFFQGAILPSYQLRYISTSHLRARHNKSRTPHEPWTKESHLIPMPSKNSRENQQTGAKGGCD